MNVDIRVPGPRDRGNVAAGSMQSSVGQEVGRILVVDDEATMRRLLEKLLRMEGYEVVLAGSGEQALAELARGGADTVLLDMRMPGMSAKPAARATPRSCAGPTER